ncbi:hypothetical protein SAMN02745671_01993 [Anaerovibrio lipolyticus DSM 3074]|uniref:Uncharacterized protein n=2 Tax=Anaerovibrio lipolyticus TaxID=82374 RepID=A0A0B2K009_9FIRM|nr:hypothetical protein NZ47_05885 [Anaerovibrio lipolyticus]SHI88067.1 hypothetical protein SAMN02745671_01993 [Anaerovibrio lipolyticus DSM 3074]
MCNKALVAGAGNNITWNSSYRWKHWGIAGNENIPSQNLASKIQVWCAGDIGIAGGRSAIDMIARFTKLTVDQIKEIGKKNALL